MKCYFAFSDDIMDKDEYYVMLEATLNSAKKNTSLELHCVYDNTEKKLPEEKDRYHKLLSKYDVEIHYSTINFYDDLLNVYNDDYLKSINVSKSSLKSRFLRFMVSDIEKTDDYILYADTDVIFCKDIKLSDFSPLPEYVGVCPEFDQKVKNINGGGAMYFNAGIMLLNLNKAREVFPAFIKMLKKGQRATIECCDQGYLNEIYRDKFTWLPNIYNWKPYWGTNPQAVIVHLHGMKPKVTLETMECYEIPFVQHLLQKDKNALVGWYYYFNLFCQYTDVDFLTVMTNLIVAMHINYQPWNFSFFRRVKRKLAGYVHKFLIR